MNIKRKKQIEELAMEILEEYHITDTPGKHLEEIAASEGIRVIPYPDWDLETCGCLMQTDGKHAIFYNTKHTPEMQTFTVAHELGHHFLNHLTDEQRQIICLNRDLQRTEARYNP